jgi:cytochrome c oxidase subunit 1
MSSAYGSSDQISYLNDPEHKGLWSWLTTVDHKRIGLMYMWSVLFFFLVAGILALLIRIEHLSGTHTIMTADVYNRVFTLHGAIMVFMFIVPAIPASLGNMIIPLQLGAMDVAFPRLNLASYYIYVIGAIVAVLSIVTGNGVDTGWTFYTPYSIKSQSNVIPMVAGVFIMGFSSILTGLNFVVTVHKLRAPGLTFHRLPIFIWAMYATSIIQVLATPVIAITLLLLIMERAVGIGIFDPALGGDPVLFEHFFWFYSHPVVYIMILPGMGIVSDIIPVFARKRLFGYRAVAYSAFGIAGIGFLVWGHHMFLSGQSPFANIVFSFITVLVAVPTAIKVFNWVATLYKGSIKLDTPMLYALSFVFLFIIAGLTGLFLAAVNTDIHYHDTYFVVAHFHYTMMGGNAIVFIGGLHYWWPKMFGRMYNETMGRVAWALVFVGFNATFLPQFWIGMNGMPRRYYNYQPEYTLGHQLSTVGSWIVATGLFLAVGNLMYAAFRGAKASQNPWDARTLEWTDAASPPITHNFAKEPVVSEGPYDYPSETV